MILKKTKRIALALLAGLVVTVVMASPSQKASEAAHFSTAQKTEIENIVHHYLLANPNVLVEVSKKLQNQEQDKMEAQAQQAIKANSQAVFFDGQSPVLGNPDGTVTMVEFYDYQCIHCKEVAPVVMKLIKANPNLRVVLKDLPIFGHNSRYAALASLAVYHEFPKQYEMFHKALFSKSGALTDEKTLSVAKASGIDDEQLAEKIKDQQYEKQLDDNYHLADEIGITGTPAFIIAGTTAKQQRGHIYFVPGAASQGALQRIIRRVSQG